MDSLLTSLSEAFGPLMLLLGALFAFAESAFGLGFVVPGETAVLTLGAATGSGGELTAAMGTVAVGAMAGDHTGYLIGRRYGTRLRDTRVVRRIGPQHWDRATRLLRRHGVLALIISRLLPAVRTLMPAAAGAADVSYSRFLAGSVVGAGLWSGLWVGMGAAARAALPEMASTLGKAGWIAFAVAVLAVAVVLLLRRRARRHRAAARDAVRAELESSEVS
ncbi:DedA family protein [Ruania zhangjianzhongii]|uniref:DedA family protein n=1 Tax=Ruania zhangjianzhongii TaxID=2603206 RepID=UPI0011CB4784|nr:DedA family protein [Ruania zhangjianzhongii]